MTKPFIGDLNPTLRPKRYATLPRKSLIRTLTGARLKGGKFAQIILTKERNTSSRCCVCQDGEKMISERREVKLSNEEGGGRKINNNKQQHQQQSAPGVIWNLKKIKPPDPTRLQLTQTTDTSAARAVTLPIHMMIYPY